MNPYDVLGVSGDATLGEIKRAYRRKAAKLHPDKSTGDAEKFKVIAMANAVLSDKSRRKLYDETGNTEDIPDTMTLALVVQEFHLLLREMFEEGKDPEQWDLVSMIRERLRGQLNELTPQINKHVPLRISKLRAVRSRLKVKKGEENALARSLDDFISRLEQTMTQMRVRSISLSRALELLKDYSFEQDMRVKAGAVVMKMYVNSDKWGLWRVKWLD